MIKKHLVFPSQLLKLVVIVFLISNISESYAQSTLSFGSEIGNNYMSENFYYSFFSGFSHQVSEKWNVAVSTGLIFKYSDNSFKGLKADILRNIYIREKLLQLSLIYLWKPYSERVEEHNAAFLITRKINPIEYSIGLYSRTFNIRRKHFNYGSFESRSHTEPLNLMYRLSYRIMRTNKINWQVGFGTFDNFIIQQETNPMILSELNFKLNENFKFILNAGYVQSGLLNIRVNYFGYYLRGGVCWFIVP